MKADYTRLWFILSLVTLAFLYGTAVGKWKWFPHSVLDRAVGQGRALYKSFTSDPASDLTIGNPQHEWSGVRAPRPEKMEPGLTSITSAWRGDEGTWRVGLKLIDSAGNVLHKWLLEREQIFENGDSRRSPTETSIHGSYLFRNGDVLVNLSQVGMARIDACGEVVWRLNEGNHHSIDRANDGAFWSPAYASEPRTKSKRYPEGYPGLNGTKLRGDRIMKISENGEVLRTIDFLDIIYSNGLERYIVMELGGMYPGLGTSSFSGGDIHLNDVEQLSRRDARSYPLFSAGDLLVSSRNLNLVMVVDPSTLNVKWHKHSEFIHQHDPDFTGDGWIGVFDNNSDFKNGEMLGGSRIVSFQPHTDSTRVRFPTRQSDPFYTTIRGKWQLLDNRNMLLTESQAGRAVEVDPDGRTVWEWAYTPVGGQIASVTKAARHDLTREDVASWPCSSVDSASTSK